MPGSAWTSIAALALATLPVLSTGVSRAADVDVVQVQRGIRTLVGGASSLGAQRARERSLAAASSRSYEPGGHAPLWFTAAGAAPVVARALAELAAAPSRGLDARDYATEWLADETRAIAEGRTGADRIARVDVAITKALLGYLTDLHDGRVTPAASGFRIDARDEGFDAVALLRNALATGRMSAAIAAAEPALPAYERLKGVLARYRDLAGGPWPPLPEPSPGTTQIVPGAAYAGAYALRERLVLLGDLSADAPPAPSPRYDATLVAAVKRFQARHGLVEDGIVGRETRRALDVPPATRVRQIELALERLRWLPPLRSGPVIAINVPSYRLWAFDAPLAPGAPALAMRVIVGRASAAMQTPIFASAMRSVEFSPYWNVPQSIVRNEILPKLRHDARYLAREDMEIVGNGTSASPPIDEATFARLASGELRIRQRPGPKNALGGIKFVLPNAMSIYLHGTPAQELFRSTRRDFSHGCIRVEDPLALAGFALRDRPEWTPERTREATTTGEPLTVPLPGPIAVLIFYTTAIVDGAGRALFLPDVYGYDARLDRALRARTATFATMAPMPVVR